MKKIGAFFAKFKDKKFRRLFILVALIVLLIVASFTYEKKIGRVQIDDSLVNAPIASIAPASPGVLKQIYVYEGENIKKGQAIANVGDQTIYANDDGLVVMANQALGSVVSTQNPVAQMINPDQMRIDGTLDENKGLDEIKVGQAVSFTVDALPGQTFWGYVDEISPTAKQTQLSFSISSTRPTQQFDIYAKFDAKTYSEIKNGMSAKMTVYTKTPNS